MDRHEKIVQQLFSDRYGLDLRPIPVSAVQTPDFDVFTKDGRIAVLEVKALESVALTLSHDEVLADDLLPGAIRPDNGSSRVAKKIHEATHQLAASAHPKILALVL